MLSFSDGFERAGTTIASASASAGKSINEFVSDNPISRRLNPKAPEPKPDDETLLPSDVERSADIDADERTARGRITIFAYLLLACGVAMVVLMTRSSHLSLDQFLGPPSEIWSNLVEAELADQADSPVCDDGLLIPGPATSRGNTALFTFLLLWSFIGVAIAADVFMVGIEVITSTEVTKVVEVHGVKRAFTVSVWNATVANLTLMALGSSAPEILLSLIEIGSSGFYSGELGPSTIVGSAAFNLLVISAVCIVSIPAGEARKIDDLGVFYITASFSVFAYVWLLVILMVISPNVVEVWEGCVTFAFFPVLVYLAYLADTGAFSFKTDGCCRILCCRRRKAPAGFSLTTGSRIHSVSEADPEAADAAKHKEVNLLLAASADKKLPVQQREKAMAKAQEALKALLPSKAGEAAVAGQDALPGLARPETRELLKPKAKSRAYYRVNATRGVTGGSAPKVEEPRAKADGDGDAPGALAPMPFLQRLFTPTTKAIIQFEAAGMSVREDVGVARVPVVRKGMLMSAATVKYATVSGSATAGEDFVDTAGELTFIPGQYVATIRVPIIDDSLVEGLEKFYVTLAPPDAGHVVIGDIERCEISIEDNDEQAQLQFEEEVVKCKESDGKAIVHVLRRGGAGETLTCHWKTKEGSATAYSEKDRAGDYVASEGTLSFPPGVTKREIVIEIVDDGEFEREEMFHVVLSQAGADTELVPCEGGKPAPSVQSTVVIVSDEGRKDLLHLMAAELDLNMDSIKLTGSSWKEQIAESVRFEGGSTSGIRRCAAVLFFVLSLPFKVAFAFVPPPRFAGGWACFLVALCFIGLLTAVIGDLAAHTGCCLGLLPSVTAITFVALGTSLPDTFASRQAAQSDDNADNSIGNITGSNSVNVFLGLGMPWAAAAIYWAYEGKSNEAAWRARYRGEPWYTEEMPVGFAVPAGDLGFSVGAFTTCALLCLFGIMGRRACVGCELGGPAFLKYASAACFVLLWFAYIAVSAASSYGLLGGVKERVEARIEELPSAKSFFGLF